MAEIIQAKYPNDSNSKLIQDWIKDKQSNEQKMLFRLNNLFRGSIQRNKIRKVVLAAFEMMHNEVMTSNEWPAFRALVAEEDLAVWNKLSNPTHITYWRIVRMHNQLLLGDSAVPRLDCNDFSELIRVIGAWIENGGGFGVQNINKAYRSGVGRIEGTEEPGIKYFNYLGELRKKYGWQYADRINNNERTELRKLATASTLIKRQEIRDNKVWAKNVRQREDPNQHHAIEDHVADFWVQPGFIKQSGKMIRAQSGMQMFRANRDDLCKKIDLLFGFITGATISGTTTDTAIVLEAFGALQKPPLHAGYYLFPVATIAASLHHSLLEAGLALTVVGAIESYCAGFYTTLIPKGGFPGELEEARNILKEHEDSQENRHMIIWYDGNEKIPAGCIRWNKPYELRDARRLTEGKGLLTHVNTIPRIPDKWAVLRFIKLMAPGLFAYLPEELQLR